VAEPGTARLFVLAGPDLARSFPLGECNTLGRSPQCDVVLRDRSISRKHALLARGEDGWVVEDLGSTNGTSKDGVRAPSIPLADGDEFKLGDLPLRLRLGVEAEEQDIDFDFSAPDPEPEPALPSAREPGSAVEPELGPALDEPALEDPDEIELEEPDDPAPRHGGVPPSRLAETAVRPRAERSTGFLGGDLEQRPGWVRALVYLVVLVFAAGLAFGAFQAVQMLRSGMQ
jgi:predicted component of type VI protein secretion system